MVVLDIGANVGDVAAVMADSVSPIGRVIAYEASPENAERLRARFNGVPHVDVRHAAVSDQPGTMTLHLDARSSKRHSLFEAAVSVRGDAISVPP